MSAMSPRRRVEAASSRVVAALRAHWPELLFVVAVTALAAVLRTYRLLDYPAGFHGDEALTGFDAQRVLDNGWIGPYVADPIGYPAGYAYWTAFVVKMAGNDAWGVRFSSALLGTLTIPVAYAAFRVMFGYRVAVLASVFFAVSAWHMLYSRVAFLPIAWPFIEVALMAPLFLAVRTRRWYCFLAAGALSGAGLYSYGSYPIFLAALGLFLLWLGVREYGLRRATEFVRDMGIVALGFFVVAFPMIQFVSDPDNSYFTRVRAVSLRETPQWQAAGTVERLDILWDAAWAWFEKMTWRGAPDVVDAAGFGPMLDQYTIALAASGLVLLIAGWRRLPYAFSLLVLVIVPWGSILTIDGAYRRSLGIIPILAVLMALPLARVWEWADMQTAARRAVAGAAIAGVVVVVGVVNVSYFFDRLAVSPLARFVYVDDLAAAARYIDETDPDYIYLFAARWGYRYETVPYLAPNVPGEDRSTEFGGQRTGDLSADRTQDVLFVLIGGYVELLPTIMQRYPEGRAYNGIAGDGRLLFVAYFVPRHPDAVDAGAGGAERPNAKGKSAHR